jgi:hypothetical protein
MHATTLQRTIRARLSSNNIISKTRIIDITINYIAIDMKAQIRKVWVVEATSKWRSHLTTFMIHLQEWQQITATLGGLVAKEPRDFIPIEGSTDKIKASSWLGLALPLATRYPCKTLIIK